MSDLSASVRAALLLGLLPVLAGCGHDPVGSEPEAEALSVTVEGALGVYRMAPGDSVDVAWQEMYYAWLQDRTGIRATGRFQYHKYLSRAHMRALTGRETNGWAELAGYRFHSIWPIDNHEAVHALISSTLSAAPALMNEGMAVAHQTFPFRGIHEARWNGVPLDELARRYRSEDRIPPLDELLASRDFFDFDTQVTYPVAGSFVTSLIERHGYPPIRDLFRDSTLEDPPNRLRANFRAAFGEELEAAWEAWLTRLEGSGPSSDRLG